MIQLAGGVALSGKASAFSSPEWPEISHSGSVGFFVCALSLSYPPSSRRQNGRAESIAPAPDTRHLQVQPAYAQGAVRPKTGGGRSRYRAVFTGNQAGILKNEGFFSRLLISARVFSPGSGSSGRNAGADN
jgi:hypothetical protein